MQKNSKSAPSVSGKKTCVSCVSNAVFYLVDGLCRGCHRKEESA